MPEPIPEPRLEWDPFKTDPKHFKVELENERVRVLRVCYGAHDVAVMHQHPRGLLVFLTDGNFKFNYPGGTTENFQGKSGQCVWFDGPWEHLPENLSGKDFEALYIEIRT